MAYPFIGVKIVMDEEKIKRDDIWPLDAIYRNIDILANATGMIKLDKNTYRCKGDSKDMICMGGFVYRGLLECDWFTKNVKEWLWLDEEEGDTDLIAFNKSQNQGAWL